MGYTITLSQPGNQVSITADFAVFLSILLQAIRGYNNYPERFFVKITGMLKLKSEVLNNTNYIYEKSL